MDEKRKIYFVLNTLGLTGGVKVIFEQANLFAQKDYEVHIIHLLRLLPGAKGLVIAWLKKIKYLFSKNKPDWFNLNSQIHTHRWISLKNKKISGYLIATANETADWVNKINESNIKKLYYILDYEIWTRKKELVEETYRLPLSKIALSERVKIILKNQLGQEVLGVATGGIDFDFFKCDNKQSNQTIKILMLYHPLPKKGFSQGLEAIKEIKKLFPEVKLAAFGAYQKPNTELIDEFYFKPSRDILKKIYHEADIFLYPALEEGFGLTLLEAAAAKCAIVTTNVGWVEDKGESMENMIITAFNSPDKMSKAIIKLINNSELRKYLGENACKSAEEFTWRNSNAILEKLIIESK